MNAELEAHLASIRSAPPRPEPNSEQRQQERADFPSRFLAAADAAWKPVLDATATTLQSFGYGATVELVRERSGSDPNSYPSITLHFSPQRCSPGDLAYVYTIAGASVGLICRRSDLCVEVVTAHPASRGVERRINFSTASLAELTAERVTRIVTEAVKQIIKG